MQDFVAETNILTLAADKQTMTVDTSLLGPFRVKHGALYFFIGELYSKPVSMQRLFVYEYTFFLNQAVHGGV